MAVQLGIADEADEQDARVGAVGWGVAELVAPQPIGLPGWFLAPGQADHVGRLAWLRDEFEVGTDDLLELRQGRGHELPISGIVCARGCRSGGSCRGRPGGRFWLASTLATAGRRTYRLVREKPGSNGFPYRCTGAPTDRAPAAWQFPWCGRTHSARRHCWLVALERSAPHRAR